METQRANSSWRNWSLYITSTFIGLLPHPLFCPPIFLSLIFQRPNDSRSTLMDHFISLMLPLVVKPLPFPEVLPSTAVSSPDVHKLASTMEGDLNTNMVSSVLMLIYAMKICHSNNRREEEKKSKWNNLKQVCVCWGLFGSTGEAF